jgi:hypothetical protein
MGGDKTPKSPKTPKTPKNDEADADMDDVDSDEEDRGFVSAIAHPLANSKLTNRALKLVKKG